MKVEHSEVAQNKVTMKVEATAEEVDRALTDGVDVFLARVGAKPLDAGEDALAGMALRFGENRAERALSDAVINYLLPFALEQEHLVPACSPVPETSPIPEAGKPFAFSVTVFTRPELELSSYEPPVVTVKREYTTDREIDERILAIAQQAATTEENPVTGMPQPVTPSITDAWVAENFPVEDINTVAELRTQLKRMLDSMKENDMERQKVNAAVAKLSERLVGDVPSEIVETMKKDMIAGIEEDLLAEGKMLDVVLKDQQITRELFEQSMEEQARATLMEGLTMDAVFRHEHLELTDADIEDTIGAIASTADPSDREAAANRLREMGRTPAIEEVAKRMKAGTWIADHAKITIEL